MGIFQQFPYSNFHEMNLDQIIKIMREMQDEWENTKTEWASYKEFIDNYFANLDLTAEVLAAMQIMLTDGTLSAIIDPVIANETADWLAANITPTTPIVDASLSISGAAADSKVTGDNFAIYGNVTGFNIIPFTPEGMITTNVDVGDPVDMTVTANNLTDYAVVPCNPGDVFFITGTGWNNQRLWAFVDSSDNLLIKSAANQTLTNGQIMSPVNAAKLIVNAKIANPRSILMIDSSLLNAVCGTGLNLNASTIEALCNYDLNNLSNNKIFGCSVTDGTLANVPTQEFTGQIITFGKSENRTNSDTQICVAADGNVYKRMYWSGAWTAWKTIGRKFLTDGRANSLASDLGGILAKVTGDVMFTANNSYWSDLPSNTGYIFINERYADNWNIQTAIGVGVDNVFQRVTRYDGTGTIYRDWTPAYNIPNVKILAVGDSICAGARNGGKGFIGGLGLDFKNDAVSGSTLSNVHTSDTPIPDQLVNETVYTPDIVIANGGINDYYYNAPLGTVPTIPARNDTEAAALNRNTVMGAAGYLFYQMVKKYPTAQRFFVTTHKVYRDDQYFTGYAPSLQNSAGYTQTDLTDALVQLCDVYNVKVINIFKDSMLNTAFSQYVSPVEWSYDPSVTNTEYVDKDGLHPLALGYAEAYLPLVREAIKTSTVK